MRWTSDLELLISIIVRRYFFPTAGEMMEASSFVFSNGELGFKPNLTDAIHKDETNVFPLKEKNPLLYEVWGEFAWQFNKELLKIKDKPTQDTINKFEGINSYETFIDYCQHLDENKTELKKEKKLAGWKWSIVEAAIKFPVTEGALCDGLIYFSSIPNFDECIDKESKNSNWWVCVESIDEMKNPPCNLGGFGDMYKTYSGLNLLPSCVCGATTQDQNGVTKFEHASANKATYDWKNKKKEIQKAVVKVYDFGDAKVVQPKVRKGMGDQIREKMREEMNAILSNTSSQHGLPKITKEMYQNDYIPDQLVHLGKLRFTSDQFVQAAKVEKAKAALAKAENLAEEDKAATKVQSLARGKAARVEIARDTARRRPRQSSWTRSARARRARCRPSGRRRAS